MKPIIGTILLLFANLSCIVAQNAEVTGTSALTITGSQVIAYGVTQLDYTSLAYYNVGASVALFQGSSDSSLSVVSQDDEVASRSSVNGTASTSISTGQVYLADTAHYVNLIYEVGSQFEDEYGFSSLLADSEDSGMVLIAPDVAILLSNDQIDFGDTY